MTAVAQRKERELAIAGDLVALFDKSGVEYTCAAAVHAVIREPAAKLAALMDKHAPVKLATRPKQCVSAAVEIIHARKYGALGVRMQIPKGSE